MSQSRRRGRTVISPSRVRFVQSDLIFAMTPKRKRPPDFDNVPNRHRLTNRAVLIAAGYGDVKSPDFMKPTVPY